MKRHHSRVTLVVVTAILSLATSPPARADNWGSTPIQPDRSAVSLANNPFHAVHYVNISDGYPNGIPELGAASDWAISEYDQTDMVAYRDEADPYPDLEVHDWNYGNLTGWVAITKCPTTNTGTGGVDPSRWCRGQQIIFNSWWYWFSSDVYDTYFQRRRLTCHEMGHSVGLRHSDNTNSCIHAHYWETTASILDTHDKSHINAHY